MPAHLLLLVVNELWLIEFKNKVDPHYQWHKHQSVGWLTVRVEMRYTEVMAWVAKNKFSQLSKYTLDDSLQCNQKALHCQVTTPSDIADYKFFERLG